jgi:cell division protein ZapA
MDTPDQLTQVQIFGRTYPIRAGVEAEYLRRLAAFVDKKMNEMSRGMKTVDALKIAVMTALEIADELHQEQDKARRLDSMVYDKSLECSRQLDQVLKK